MVNAAFFNYMECIFMRIKKPHLRPIVITLSVGGIFFDFYFYDSCHYVLSTRKYRKRFA